MAKLLEHSLKYPSTLQSSNIDAYPIVLASEVGGHKAVSTKDDLANLSVAQLVGNTEDIAGSLSYAIGQLWYVTTEKTFYQLTDLKEDGTRTWAASNIGGAATASTAGNNTTLLTSVTVGADGKLTYTSTDLSRVTKLETGYTYLSSAYAYVTEDIAKVRIAYDNLKKGYDLLTTYVTSTYTNVKTAYTNLYNGYTALYNGYISSIGSIKLVKDANNDLKYDLMVNGASTGSINIPKDQFFKECIYDEGNHRLIMIFMILDDSGNLVEQTTYIPLTDFIDIYTGTNGIKVEKSTSSKNSYEIGLQDDLYKSLKRFNNGTYVTQASYNNLQTSYNALSKYVTTTYTNVKTAYDNLKTGYDKLTIYVKNAYAYSLKYTTTTYDLGYAYSTYLSYYITSNTEKIQDVNDGLVDLSIGYLKLADYTKTSYDSLYNAIQNTAGIVTSGVVSAINNFTADKENAYLNYTKGSSSLKVQLDGATQTKAGVMTVEDKINLDAIYAGDKNIVTPAATGTFTVYKNDGTTQVKTRAGTSISLEQGYKVKWSGTWKWTHNDSYKDPTSTSGNQWGSTLPSSGVSSSTWTSSVLSSGGTIASQTIYAAKKGLMVSGSKVVPATGNDSASCSVSWSTYTVNFKGIVTTVPTTSAGIMALTKAQGGKTLSVSGITTTSTQYYVFAYPKSLGALSKIVQDGATGIFSSFDCNTVSVTLDSGLAVDYYVYSSHNPGAFTGAKIEFS